MGVQIHVRKKDGQLLFRLYNTVSGEYFTSPLSMDRCGLEYILARMLAELPLRNKDVAIILEQEAEKAERYGHLHREWKKGFNNGITIPNEIYKAHRELSKALKPLLTRYLQKIKKIEAKSKEQKE